MVKPFRLLINLRSVGNRMVLHLEWHVAPTQEILQTILAAHRTLSRGVMPSMAHLGAADAQARPGQDLQPLCRYRQPALLADAISVLVEPAKRGIDLGQMISFGAFQRQLEGLLGGIAGNVGLTTARVTLLALTLAKNPLRLGKRGDSLEEMLSLDLQASALPVFEFCRQRRCPHGFSTLHLGLPRWDLCIGPLCATLTRVNDT